MTRAARRADDTTGGKPACASAGTISAIRDCGTIVLLVLRTEDGRLIPVGFDRRQFRHLIETEQCSSADLVGRRASSDGLTLTFVR